MLSLALGIGANTAIYSFMDAILLRSLPVADPDSLVVMTWRAKPIASQPRPASSSCVRSGAHLSDQRRGLESRIFPFRHSSGCGRSSCAVLLQQVFARFAGDRSESSRSARRRSCRVAEYVSGDFFAGLGLQPAAGRLLIADDDRPARRRWP